MQVADRSDIREFLEEAGPLLLADEARHNLMLGIAGTLRDHPGHYREHRCWLVLDGETVAAAALRTPPFNLVIAGGERPLEVLAERLDDEPPGVVGAVPEVEAFARAWEARHGVRRQVAMSQGVYALDELIEPPRPSGAPRHATVADRQLLSEWLREFTREVLHTDEVDEEQHQRVLDARLGRPDAGFVIWEDGVPVSTAGFGGATPNGARIGPVYTPPEHRGRGYGSAVTAAVTAERLAAGRRFCFLYTDLENPTSNKIYVAMGYRRVCDSLDLRFV